MSDRDSRDGAQVVHSQARRIQSLVLSLTILADISATFFQPFPHWVVSLNHFIQPDLVIPRLYTNVHLHADNYTLGLNTDFRSPIKRSSRR